MQNYPEIYFAKVVVIGEGDGEDILLGHTMKVMNFDFDYNVLTFGATGVCFTKY